MDKLYAVGFVLAYAIFGVWVVWYLYRRGRRIFAHMKRENQKNLERESWWYLVETTFHDIQVEFAHHGIAFTFGADAHGRMNGVTTSEPFGSFMVVHFFLGRRWVVTAGRTFGELFWEKSVRFSALYDFSHLVEKGLGGEGEYFGFYTIEEIRNVGVEIFVKNWADALHDREEVWRCVAEEQLLEKKIQAMDLKDRAAEDAVDQRVRAIIEMRKGSKVTKSA